MDGDVRTVIRRWGLATALALPLVLVPGHQAAHASADVPIPAVRLDIGQVANLDGTMAALGDVVGHLSFGPSGCDASGTPIGVIYAPGTDGMKVTLSVDDLCDVIVFAITNTTADIADDVAGAIALSPGAGVPALPESVNDAVADPGLVTTIDGANVGGIVTCKHQGWSKSTLLYHDIRWVTATESRVQANWSSTGYRNECYGRSVTNMVVNTNAKYSYCYWSPWEASKNDGCWYTVRKEAPEETAAKVWGRYKTDDQWYDLNARVYADTGSPFLAQCYITNGTLPPNSKIDCHGRQDY